jgi:peptidyl-prolyl cis-trans isomerase C
MFLFGGCGAATHVAETDKLASKLQKAGMAKGKVTQEAGDIVIATVNGKPITMSEYNNKLKLMSPFERARYSDEDGHKKFLRTLIQRKLMLQEARRIKLDRDTEVLQKIDQLLQEITERGLIETLVEREVMNKTVVTDEEAKRYYNQHKDEFTEKEQVKARHILVLTAEVAGEIRRALENGGDFAQLAETQSIDQHTAKNGGDLGYFERGQMVPEFEKSCFGLKVGEISGVVETQFGYHIIKLEDKKEAVTKVFYEVSDEIKKRLIADKQRAEYQKWLDRLEKKAKIEMDEEFFSN